MQGVAGDFLGKNIGTGGRAEEVRDDRRKPGVKRE